MKNKNLTSLASVALLAAFGVQAQALAQDDMNKAAEKTITPYGLLGANVYLTESENSNPLNFQTLYARLGLKVSEGIAKGRLELAARNDKVDIRHANVGLALETGTTLTFGRYRPGGASGWGVDASLVPDQFASMDGLHVEQELEFAEDISVKLGLGAANGQLALGDVSDLGSTTKAKNRVFEAPSTKTDRALLLNVTANVKGVELVAYHGMESNQLVVDAKEAEGETAAVPPSFADATHTEVSLGYNLDAIGVGAWYTNFHQDGLKQQKTNKGGKLDLNDAADVSFDRTNIGFGVAGDSSLFGVTGLLQPEDKLIYGASYAMISYAADGGGKELEDAAKDAGYNQIAVGGGYKVGGLTLELNVAQYTGESKLYANSDGEENKEDSKLDVYLATYYVF